MPSSRGSHSNVQSPASAVPTASAAALDRGAPGAVVLDEQLRERRVDPDAVREREASQASDASWKRGSAILRASHASVAASAAQTIVSVAPEVSDAAPMAASVNAIAQSRLAESRSRTKIAADDAANTPAIAEQRDALGAPVVEDPGRPAGIRRAQHDQRAGQIEIALAEREPERAGRVEEPERDRDGSAYLCRRRPGRAPAARSTANDATRARASRAERRRRSRRRGRGRRTLVPSAVMSSWSATGIGTSIAPTSPSEASVSERHARRHGAAAAIAAAAASATGAGTRS